MPATPEQLRDRWLTRDGRRVLMLVLEAIQAGREWKNLLGGLPYVEEVANGLDLRGANLNGVSLSGSHLDEVDLSGASLLQADLSHCNMPGAKLRDAVLDRSDLQGAVLRWADLRGAKLRNADLREADLRAVRFDAADIRRADLREANVLIRDLVRTEWKGVKVTRPPDAAKREVTSNPDTSGASDTPVVPEGEQRTEEPRPVEPVTDEEAAYGDG